MYEFYLQCDYLLNFSNLKIDVLRVKMGSNVRKKKISLRHAIVNGTWLTLMFTYNIKLYDDILF
jgi:hypothetical protein